jgi:hypothetical protein
MRRERGFDVGVEGILRLLGHRPARHVDCAGEVNEARARLLILGLSGNGAFATVRGRGRPAWLSRRSYGPRWFRFVGRRRKHELRAQFRH